MHKKISVAEWNEEQNLEFSKERNVEEKLSSNKENQIITQLETPGKSFTNRMDQEELEHSSK